MPVTLEPYPVSYVLCWVTDDGWTALRREVIDASVYMHTVHTVRAGIGMRHARRSRTPDEAQRAFMATLPPEAARIVADTFWYLLCNINADEMRTTLSRKPPPDHP